MKKSLLLLLFISSSMFSMEFDRVIRTDNAIMSVMELDRISYADNAHKMYIQPFSVKVPERLGNIDLYHGRKGFYVRQDDKKQTIKKYFTDPILRDITKTQLRAFLANGYLTLNQMDDGEFSLKAKGRMVGGGPLFGAAAYWITKSLCYGTIAAGTGAAVITTGGAIAGAVAGGAAAGGAGTVAGLAIAGNAATGTVIATSVATTAGTAIATTAGAGIATAGMAGLVGTGAGGVAVGLTATVGTAALGEAAVLTTGAALATGATTGGVIAATVIGIEATSVAVGSFFGMLPFTP
jgi:hypothetical protein